MKFFIEESLFTEFSPVIGVIVARGIDNTGSSGEIGALLRAEEERAQEKFSAEGSIGAHPFISVWRKIYKKMGADSYRCSSEALTRRAVKGDKIPSINKLVDLYNLVSLKHTIPIGGENTDAMVGDLVLGEAKGDEPFVRIGSEENDPPLVGEVVYKDDVGVICRRWNWREADRTKLTAETKNAIIVVDGVANIGREAVAAATEELEALIGQYCGGSVHSAVLDKESPEIRLV